MKRISKREFYALKEAGKIKDGGNGKDKNYRVANREHCSRNKHYYVTTTYDIINYLNRMNSDIQKKQISPTK